MLLVGNDIVDLYDAGIAGKSKNARFVKKVCSDEEQAAISASKNPDLILWMIWAAKETAYKITSKMIGPTVFSHKEFKTTFLEPTLASKFNVEVVYRSWKYQLEIDFNRNYIHAAGGQTKTGERSDYFFCEKVHQMMPVDFKTWGNKIKWTDNFTENEQRSIHQAESAFVRFLCKKSIAAKLKIPPSRLQIIRPLKDRKPQPPFLLIDHSQTDIDISLSHHGSWLGWCFSLKK